MEPIKVKTGFPNIRNGNTVCPFCGSINGDIEGVHSGHFYTTTFAEMRFNCVTGCTWDLRLQSEDGEIPAAQCALLDLDTELVRISFWGSITDWVRLQKNFVSDEPA